jgi:hypothetical protein
MAVMSECDMDDIDDIGELPLDPEEPQPAASATPAASAATIRGIFCMESHPFDFESRSVRVIGRDGRAEGSPRNANRFPQIV